MRHDPVPPPDPAALRRARDRRDTVLLLMVTLLTGVTIALVLWAAGAFRPSSG